MSKEILIAKYGTKCIVRNDRIDQPRVNLHATRLVGLMDEYRVGVVSSGSFGAGKRKINNYRPDLSDKLDLRTIAAIGSSSAFHTWRRAFGKHSIEGFPVIAAELKATHDNMDDPDEGKSLVDVFLDCVRHGIVPVFNINDTLDRYKDELGGIAEGRDNDHAAEHLARKVGANTLMLLTANVDGVLVEGEVQRLISSSNIGELDKHLTSTDEDGTGSMISKIHAGLNALRGGVENVFIGSSGASPQDIIGGQQGTRLVL